MTDFNEFHLWKKDIIQEYLLIRGLPTTGSKDELMALALVRPLFLRHKPVPFVSKIAICIQFRGNIACADVSNRAYYTAAGTR